MKVKNIKLVEIIDNNGDDKEEYTYGSKYTRKSDDIFTVRYSSTSKIKVCPLCGEWIYQNENECTCNGKEVHLSEREVIDILEEALNDYDSNTRIKVNGVYVN